METHSLVEANDCALARVWLFLPWSSDCDGTNWVLGADGCMSIQDKSMLVTRETELSGGAMFDSSEYTYNT